MNSNRQALPDVFTYYQEIPMPEYYVNEHCYNIPCNCEISPVGKLCQNLIGGIKMGIEFFLFMGYAIGRREEFLECHYPFARRTIYSDEMKKLNRLRRQVNQRPAPIKHTITNTYYDIH